MITMSTEKTYHTNSAARSFERRFSDPSLTSTPLSMAVNSNRDNDIVAADPGTSNIKLVPEMTPNVHHAPYETSPVSVPVLASMPSVSKKPSSTSSSAPECPSTNTSPSNTNCSAFQGAHVYMDRPIVANIIHLHGNERLRSQNSQILMSALSVMLNYCMCDECVATKNLRHANPDPQQSDN